LLAGFGLFGLRYDPACFSEREKRFELSTSTLAKPVNGVSGRSWARQVAEIT
jgi:hypothetical protein